MEFRKDAVILHVNGKLQEIPNDYAWIFAGEEPAVFLRKTGVGFAAQVRDQQGSQRVEGKRDHKKWAMPW